MIRKTRTKVADKHQNERKRSWKDFRKKKKKKKPDECLQMGGGGGERLARSAKALGMVREKKKQELFFFSERDTHREVLGRGQEPRKLQQCAQGPVLPTPSGCQQAPGLGWAGLVPRNEQLAPSAVRGLRLAAAGQAPRSRGSLHPRSEGTRGARARPAGPGERWALRAGRAHRPLRGPPLPHRSPPGVSGSAGSGLLGRSAAARPLWPCER